MRSRIEYGVLLVTVLAFTAMGCSSLRPTGYVRASVWNDGYGYVDRLIGPDEYSIAVHGNPLTSAESAAEIAFLRAAHLALENGYERFEILDREEALRTRFVRSTAPMGIGVSTMAPVKIEPLVVLLVRLSSTDRPLGPTVLDARAVVADLD